MNTTRPPAVAGTFYPEDAAELRAAVEQAIAGGAGEEDPRRPRALIAPHAGYRFSGSVAGSAYRALGPDAGAVSRAVVLSPSHHFPFEGIALSRCESFATPLGEVPVDHRAQEMIDSFPGTHYLEAAHRDEHGIEVQLPFLQVAAGKFSLVPVVLGEVAADMVETLLEVFVRDPHTLLVASSDLSHYLDYDAARHADAETCREIEGLRDDRLTPANACGARAIAGLLRLSRRHQWQAATLDLRNSGDAGGDRAGVVGYGAWRFDK